MITRQRGVRHCGCDPLQAGAVSPALQIGSRLGRLAEGMHALQRLGDRHPACPGCWGPLWATRSTIRHGGMSSPPDIANGGAGAERAEGDDLGDVVAAILVCGVIEDRWRLSSWKSRSKCPASRRGPDSGSARRSAVLERIDQRDLECIGDNRSGGRAARRCTRCPVRGEAAQIPHDQEVGLKPIWEITPSSYSRREWIAGSVARAPKRRSSPSRHRRCRCRRAFPPGGRQRPAGGTP